MPGQRLRIGAFEVDLAAREVIDPATGHAHRVTDKARAVLVELIAAGGQVVKREQLMDRVWAGTLPTGDVLTQAVTTLRKAFRDDAEHPRYIETIAKTGYRLLAEVAVLDAPVRPLPVLSVVGAPNSGPAPGPVATSRPASRIPWSLRILAVLVLLLLAAGIWMLLRPPGAPESGRVGDSSRGGAAAPVIIAAGIEHEYAPRLSPDGTRVVYSSIAPGANHARLVVQDTVAGGARLVLTDSNDVLSDTGAAWSADGQSIVFVRRGAGTCQLMQVSSLGGLPRALGDCARGPGAQFDLAPDGTSLLMPLRADDGTDTIAIHRLDLATGTWSRLDYRREAGDIDFDPRYAPDGRSIAFRRGLSAGDLWTMPSTGGETSRLTHLAADIRGFDYTPDGRALVFSAITPEGLDLLRVNLADGALGRAGIESATSPDIGAQGQLVFERSPERLQLKPFDPVSGDFGAPLYASSASDMMAAFSPDGKRVALYSDRSGALAVWIVDAGIPERAGMVPQFMPVARFAPSWSADGTRLVVHGEGTEGTGLFEIDTASLRAQRLPLPTGREYRFGFLAEGRIYAGWVGGREGELGVHEFREGGWVEVARRSDVAAAQYDPGRRRLLFTKVGRAGLFAMDPMLAGETQLLEHVPSPRFYRRWWLATDERIWIADVVGDAGVLWAAPLADLRQETLVRHANPFGSASGYTPHPDGRIVASVMVGEGADIGFLPELPTFSPMSGAR